MLIRLSIVVLVVMAATGCGRGTTSTFEGHDADAVWTAMTSVAESPRYDDWTISTNDVWVDEANNRIEILRKLKRHLHRPRTDPVGQRREFRLRITLESQDPPVVRFRSRGLQVPAHVWEERDRFMDDVLTLLQGTGQ